ncbi:MAG: hypothetical protein M3Z09_09960 [Acidobacteriota bacterium]|nr:hypothetical protein [Acidobacteriota bacterium]
MRRFTVLLLLLFPLLQARAPGGHAVYVGGTNADLPRKAEGWIQTTDANEMRFAGKLTTVRVPYENITNIEYGQKVGRRYVEALLISPILLLAKKRSHFLTVGYTGADGTQQAMVFQLSQADVRVVLVGLEARTGRKVEYQDDEARKAGKG